MEYTIVIEKTPGNHAAYVPDLPGYFNGHTPISRKRRQSNKEVR